MCLCVSMCVYIYIYISYYPCDLEDLSLEYTLFRQ